jgi:cytochrome c55X
MTGTRDPMGTIRLIYTIMPLPVLLLAMGFALPVLADEPPRARQNELLYLLEQDCGSCHGLRLKGGLGPPLLPADIAEQPDEALVDAILLGRPGTPMPPWDVEITEAEVTWLVGRLRTGKVAYDK